MDLTTGIVFGADYCGDEVNELAVASFNYVKQDIADVKKRYCRFIHMKVLFNTLIEIVVS